MDNFYKFNVFTIEWEWRMIQFILKSSPIIE